MKLTAETGQLQTKTKLQPKMKLQALVAELGPELGPEPAKTKLR